MFGLQYNTLLVIAGTGLLGLSAGVIGAFAVLRRRALMGDALSHAALPGLCIAFMLYGERNFLVFMIGAVISGVIGVLCVSLLRHHTRIKEDAAIGLVLSVFYGAGIVLLSIIQRQRNGQQAGLESYLFGQTASMVMQDLATIIGVTLLTLLILLLFYKEFKILSFDREFAAVQGWPTLFLDLAMMVLLVITTVAGLPAVGVVLMAALLIIPGVSARFWTDRLDKLLLLAGLFGLLSGVIGTLLSDKLDDLPAGPVIVLSGSIIFFLSMLFAPRRGVISRVLQHLALRGRVARQNLLRSFYELSEPDLPALKTVSTEALVHHRGWTLGEVKRLLNSAQAEKQIEPVGASDAHQWRLTAAGLSAAADVVRVHRLWEIFLIEHADIAPDHVDRDADQIEHILSPELIARLESHLFNAGRWPKAAVPASPHKIDAGVMSAKESA